MSDVVFAEALSTTSVGMGSRSLSWVPATAPATTEGGEITDTTITEVLAGPVLCHRVSAPSSIFTLEVGASGCLMKGNDRNFASSMSGHFTLIYYPFSSRMKVSNEDSAVRLKQMNFTNLYILGKTGFSKTTLGFGETPFSYAVDAVDVGGGVGYSYRLFKYVAVGVEAGYVYSSSISPLVATGSSTLIEYLGSLTIFL